MTNIALIGVGVSGLSFLSFINRKNLILKYLKKVEVFLEDFQQEGQSVENLIMVHNFLQLKITSLKNFFF